MSATACQHAPPGIATTILRLPLGLGSIVQALRNAFVGRLGIEDGLERLELVGSLDVAPVVLLGLGSVGRIAIAATLAIATVSRLEHIEVEPFGIVPPGDRTGAAKGMIGDKVILVVLTNGVGQSLPHLGLHVAALVAADDPDDVGTIAIALSKELAIGLCLLDVHQPCLDKTAPDADHTDVDATLLGLVEDVVEVIPIGVGVLQGTLCLGVEGREVEHISLLVGNHRRLAIDVVGGHAIDRLHLHDVISCVGTLRQIEADLCAIEFLGHQPARLALPEERRAVGMLEIEMVFADLQTTVRPGLLVWSRCKDCHACAKKEEG